MCCTWALRESALLFAVLSFIWSAQLFNVSLLHFVSHVPEATHHTLNEDNVVNLLRWMLTEAIGLSFLLEDTPTGISILKLSIK